MNARAYRKHFGRFVATAALTLVLGGAVEVPEIAVAVGAAVVATLYSRGVVRTARVCFRPRPRWSSAIAKALPQLVIESALLAGAVVRQITGGRPIAGKEDAAHVVARGADTVTAAIAAAAYPCLTPNTVVRAVERGGWVTGRRILDRPGHTLGDDLARLG